MLTVNNKTLSLPDSLERDTALHWSVVTNSSVNQRSINQISVINSTIE